MGARFTYTMVLLVVAFFAFSVLGTAPDPDAVVAETTFTQTNNLVNKLLERRAAADSSNEAKDPEFLDQSLEGKGDSGFDEFDSSSRRTDSAETICTQNGLDIQQARTDCVSIMQ